MRACDVTLRAPDNHDPAPALDFRGAFRLLAGGVSVISTSAGAVRTGMTVTSVTALSADPPTLIVCVNQSSSSYPVLREARCFGVNILAAGQRDVAERFSGVGGVKGDERYHGADWFTLATGAPLLAGALAVLDCAVEDIIERHSHAIIIGAVRATQVSPVIPALCYWNKTYRVLDS